MDAGPQVKILTTEKHVEAISKRIRDLAVTTELLVARPGGEPTVSEVEEEADQ